MSTGAAKDWRRAFGIQNWKPPSYFASKSEIDSVAGSVPQAHALRRAFDRLSLSGVLCLHNNPVIYFKEVESIDPEQVTALHKQFWNQGLAPILVLIDDREVHIYSGLARPATGAPCLGTDERLVHRLNRIADAAAIRQLVLSIESGDFFRIHARSFNPKQRVDRELLRNLQATRAALAVATKSKLDTSVLDALLCRLVFVCYLFDRGVIGRSYLTSVGVRDANHLRDILSREKQQAKNQLYTLFKRLGDDFNGDLFSEDLDSEARHIASKHLEILDQFLHGTDVATGQGAFWPYDFEMIPIETISAIYEHFLKAEDSEGKKKAGAFYTPRFLAEIALDISLEGMDQLLDKRFLDPACGSGIFLVGIFNRLAEEWKRNNPAARYDRRASSLIAILRNNIAGVDVNPTACKIAVFSLYLALLDQLSPPDIQELQRKGKVLPRLVCSSDRRAATNGTTIYCGDFFSNATQVIDGADVVLGNPPWASLTGPVTSAETWCEHFHLPVPNRQLATAFVWKAVHHQRPGGRVCFVLPHGVLFNHQRTALDFQHAWLEQHAVDVVLNLADMRFNLFEAAVGPALIVRYRKESPIVRDHRVKYLVPKTSWSVSQAELVPVVPEDRTEVRLKDVLADLKQHRATHEWKQRFWGTPRDWKLLDRLSLLPRLSDVVATTRESGQKRWIVAEGFKPQLSENKTQSPVRRPWTNDQLFLKADSADADLFLLRSDCAPIGKRYPWLHRRISASDIFLGPHVLVWYGLRVAYADFDVLFRHGIRGIHGPRCDADLLMFLAAYLRSPLAQYFLFHTSAYWGIERKQVHLEELLRVPFPLPGQTGTAKRNRDILKEVASHMKAAAERAQRPSADRAGIVRAVQDALNALVYEYFGIIDVERALIEDTESVVIESILPKRASASLPTLKEASPDYRKRYVDVLCQTLNDWAREGPYRIHGRTYASSSSGIATVVLDRTRNGPPPPSPDGDDAVLLSVLDTLQRVFTKELGSIELLRGVKVFEKDSLYLFKPLSQRFWTRTAALNDADDIAATVLTRSLKERA